MKLSTRAFLTAAAGLTALAAAAPASAQYYDRNNNTAVRERARPGYDSDGAPLGAFRLFLTLPVGVVATDNVYARPDGDSDVIVTVSPTAEIRSQWSRHELEGQIEVQRQQYQDFDREDRTDVTLTGNGQLDIDRSLAATFHTSAGWLHEPRTDSSSPVSLLEPVQFNQFRIEGALRKDLNVLRISGSAALYDVDFDNALAADGVTQVFQDDRDHQATTVSARADYTLTAATALYGSVVATNRYYDLKPGDDPNVAFSRNANDQTAYVGVDFDITNLVRGDVSVGYFTESFSDPGFNGVDGFATSARLEWFPTPLATFQFNASRTVTDTGVAGAAGALATTLGAQVDYELKRNVIVTGRLTHLEEEFEGVSRDDTGYVAGIDTIYLFNRHLGAMLTLQRRERNSSGANAGREFEEQRLALSLVLRN